MCRRISSFKVLEHQNWLLAHAKCSIWAYKKPYQYALMSCKFVKNTQEKKKKKIWEPQFFAGTSSGFPDSHTANTARVTRQGDFWHNSHCHLWSLSPVPHGKPTNTFRRWTLKIIIHYSLSALLFSHQESKDTCMWKKCSWKINKCQEETSFLPL